MNKQGWCLVESLIVLAILGLLTTIAIPAYCQYRDATNAANLGVVLVTVHGDNIGYNESTFEVVQLSKDCMKIAHTYGVIDLSKTTLASWKRLNETERLLNLLPVGASIPPLGKRAVEAPVVKAVTAVSSPIDNSLIFKETYGAIGKRFDFVLVNGHKYFPKQKAVSVADTATAITPSKSLSIKDNEKWKYIEESFKK